MNIENEIFKRTTVNFDKLGNYGFKKENGIYVFEKQFLNGNFKAIITISDKGIVSGRVIDLQMNDEYLELRTQMSLEFANKVRQSYKDILIDIKNNCFDERYFLSNQANRIAKCIKDKYNNEPEFLWNRFKGYGVFRKSDNKKWYGIIMNIDLSKLDEKTGKVEILNVKLKRDKIKKLLKHNGFYEAYHMSKKDWISIILDDILEDKIIMDLIDESYNLVK